MVKIYAWQLIDIQNIGGDGSGKVVLPGQCNWYRLKALLEYTPTIEPTPFNPGVPVSYVNLHSLVAVIKVDSLPIVSNGGLM